LSAIRKEVLALHKTLIDSERATYESTFGKIDLKGDFLQLLISDPWFAWLRPLTQLLASIDEALDGPEPLTEQDAKVLVERARTLLKPSDAGVGFADHYRDALQRDPDVVLAHASTAKFLKGKRGNSGTAR
jgi:hypothetical protein